jgi:hypothetical protein
VHEIKYDGCLMARRGSTLVLSDRCPASRAAAKLAASSFTIDGEAVVCGLMASQCSTRSTGDAQPRTRSCMRSTC